MSHLSAVRRTPILAVAALVAGLALTGTAAPASASRADTTYGSVGLQQGLDQLVADGAPGALLYTYDHGRVTELQSGVADIAGTPMSGQDHYRIGSSEIGRASCRERVWTVV